jgi:hypothetical protein
MRKLLNSLKTFGGRILEAMRASLASGGGTGTISNAAPPPVNYDARAVLHSRLPYSSSS